jgi:hypothetical protein
MNASEAALKAAGIMSERGHCKRATADAEGRVCFIGAVIAVPGISDGDPLRIMVTAEHVLAERGIRTTPIEWNNHPETTGEDVILLLKETAERLSLVTLSCCPLFALCMY